MVKFFEDDKKKVTQEKVKLTVAILNQIPIEEVNSEHKRIRKEEKPKANMEIIVNQTADTSIRTGQGQ